MPKENAVTLEFHVAREARDRYQFDEALFSLSGNVIFNNFHGARVFAQKINDKRDLVRFPEQTVRAGHINAMGLIDEILHFVTDLYREQKNREVMRLALDSDPRINLVHRYGGGELVIGTAHITRPCIVSPDKLVLEWNVSSFAELSESVNSSTLQLEPLLAFGAAIVLLGAGPTQPLPGASLLAAFRARAIALECMNLGAACRTYNVLASEQRAVVAGLFP